MTSFRKWKRLNLKSPLIVAHQELLWEPFSHHTTYRDSALYGAWKTLLTPVKIMYSNLCNCIPYCYRHLSFTLITGSTSLGKGGRVSHSILSKHCLITLAFSDPFIFLNFHCIYCLSHACCFYDSLLHIVSYVKCLNLGYSFLLLSTE